MNIKPVVGFIAAGVLVMLVALASLWAVKQSERAADLQTHTLLVMNATHDLLLDLNDAGTGQRDYIETGNEAFLESYLAVRDTLKGRLSELRQLTRDKPAQHHRLDVLSPLIEDRMAILQQTIDLRRRQDSAAALEILRNGRGKQLMATIRAEMRNFENAEADLLVQREAQFRSSQGRLSGLILLANVFFVLLIMLATYLLHRESSLRIKARIDANRMLDQANKTLREHAVTLAQFKYTLDHTLDGVFIFHADTLRFIYVNHGAVQQVAYSEDELLHMTPLDIMPEFIEPRFRTMLQSLRDGSLTATTFEALHRHKDGHDIPVEIVLQYVKTDDQDPHFIAFSRDITCRKQAEATLRIAAVAFESQESLIITDTNGVILRVNPAFTRDTGYTAEETVGQTPRLLKSGRHNAAFYAQMWDTLLRTGTWQGEIWNRHKNGEICPKWLTLSAVKDSNENVTHYVGTHIDITERKAAEEEIKSLAFYDPLTGLPNRRLLMVRLKQALASSARNGREGALLFIDLDNFKTLNDTLGHDFGDLLLQQVALRLESCIREGDTVARLGGDEFVVMLEDLSGHVLEASALTQAVGEKILATLGQPYQLISHEYHSTPSIGATLFNHDQQTIAELLKKADIAMYQAKKAGRNTLRFFDPKMQVTINARAALEGELRRALEGGQFNLHYQIQVNSLRQTEGAEALIRWTHPVRGLLSPDQFITLAEETGLILPIGLWVLETACAQIRTWQQALLTRNLVLAINVSSRQFHQPDFVAQVQAAVQRHAINPMLLKLELTESLLLENIEDTIQCMDALKRVGVQLSLDDFGSGYSSLRHLQRMPLDQIKIDSSFIHDIATDNSDNAVVRTIIAMAQSLNMDVIAEGVEMKEQRQLLLDKGCTHYQGYLFGKPLPIEQFDEMLKS
ncbi:MAG: EAL domain-containing protein [Gallionella sp.]|jgi:diguanylate cyclase (GGDEF)-like protein/PAS domain S-box-containing protein